MKKLQIQGKSKEIKGDMPPDTTTAEMIKEQTDYEEIRERIQVEQGLCLSKVIHDNWCISHNHCCLPQE